MSIPTTCPECRSRFNLADEQVGKKIRCGKCQAVFVAQPAGSDRRRDEDDSSEEITTAARARPRSTGIVTPPPRKATVAAGRRRDDDTEDDQPARRKTEENRSASRADGAPGRSNVPWVVGGLVACVGMLTLGGIVVALLLRPDDRPPVANNTPQPPPPTVVQPVAVPPPVIVDTPRPPVVVTPPSTPTPTPTPVAPPERDPVKRGNGELTREARDAVTRSTVYIRVTTAEGIGSGTGFFGDPQAPNIVLTNAHVVGMLSPDSPRPQNIEIILNSGFAGEKKITARVLGVDRISDLAVLDTGITDGMPKALTVKASTGIEQLDKVYVFGYPFGEQLGKEITIRNSTVSSLRKNSHGVLDKIQVNGGMDPGNSGGPVVDENGHVVGVAVSGIVGAMINFAIPGERVHAILGGRISDLTVGLPFKDGAKIGSPVVMEMIDPRNRIKEVALDVWTGDPPPPKGAKVRLATDAPPTPKPGDSERQRVRLTYTGGVGLGDVIWPDLPAGKVYWVQPLWVRTTGETQWGTASVHKMVGSPIERKAIALNSRYVSGPGGRTLNLAVTNRMRVGADADGEVGSLITKVGFSESVQSSGASGAALLLQYVSADQNLIMERRILTRATMPIVKANLSLMRARVQLDALGGALGGPTSGELDITIAMRRKLQADTFAQMKKFNDPVKVHLISAMLPLPNKTVAPKESWKTERMLGVETLTGDTQKVRMGLTCTYLGVRTNGRRQEAVIQIVGAVKDPQMGGKASGEMIVDVSSGTVTRVHLKSNVDLPAIGMDLGGKMQRIKLRSLMTLELDRAPS